MRAFLSPVAYRTGPMLRIDAERWPEAIAPAMRELCSDGFVEVSAFDQSFEEELLDGLDHFFAQPGSPQRDAVDNLLIVSETLFGAAFPGSGDIQLGAGQPRGLPDRKRLTNQLVTRAGLNRARPIGMSMGGCSNISAALHLAAALVHSELSAVTLIVAIEQLAPHEARIMENLAAPLSDIVLCVAVGTEGESEIVRCAHALMPGVVRMRLAGEPLMQGLELARASRRLLDDLYDASTIAAVTSDNFRRAFYDVALSGSTLGYDDLSLPTKASLAHAFACEGLVNVAELRNAGAVGAGDDVLVLNFGRSILAATVLRLR